MRSEQFETFEYVLTEIDIFLCYTYSSAFLWRLHAKSFECFLTANEYFNLSFIAKITFIPLTYILKMFLKQFLRKQVSAKQSNAFISQIFTEYPLIDKCIGLITVNRIHGWETHWNSLSMLGRSLCKNVVLPHHVCIVFSSNQPITMSE